MKRGELMSVRYNNNLTSTIRTPAGLADAIDEILKSVKDKTGVKFSRNSFILKSIRFYIDHLLRSENMKEVLTTLHLTDTE